MRVSEIFLSPTAGCFKKSTEIENQLLAIVSQLHNMENKLEKGHINMKSEIEATLLPVHFSILISLVFFGFENSEVNKTEDSVYTCKAVCTPMYNSLAPAWPR